MKLERLQERERERGGDRQTDRKKKKMKGRSMLGTQMGFLADGV